MKHTFFMLWVLFFLLTTSPLKAVLIKYGEESEGKGHISVSFKTRTSKLRQPPVEGEGPLKEIKIKSGDLEVKFKETVSEFLENKKIHSLGFLFVDFESASHLKNFEVCIDILDQIFEEKPVSLVPVSINTEELTPLLLKGLKTEKSQKKLRDFQEKWKEHLDAEQHQDSIVEGVTDEDLSSEGDETD